MMAVVHSYIDTVRERNWRIEDTVLVLIGVAMVVMFAFVVQRYRSSKAGKYIPIKDGAETAWKKLPQYV